MSTPPTINEDTDLPLLANVDEIRAKHYMLRLKCSLSQKWFHSEVIIFMLPVLKKEKQVCILSNFFVRKNASQWGLMG